MTNSTRDSFEGQAAELIPADVRMISGCQDSQTSADVSNVSAFQLPDPAGRSGGACTSALLKVLYNEDGKTNNGQELTFVQVLTRMRSILKQGKYSQIPQLSSSRKMDIQEDFAVVPPSQSNGTKRAILVGINYVGQKGELSGCHNDVGNIQDYLVKNQGFQQENITVLMDDGTQQSPTYDNIIAAFRKLVSETESGDCAFFHYSGHGGRLEDDDGDEDDGYDETLIPVDYQSAGQIRDDLVFSELVGRMPEGSTLTCLMDCCHSGSVLDLPYTFMADGQQDEMQQNPNANMSKLKMMALSFLIAKIFGSGMMSQLVMSVLSSSGAMSGGGSSSGGGGGLGGMASSMVSVATVQSVANMVCAK